MPERAGRKLTLRDYPSPSRKAEPMPRPNLAPERESLEFATGPTIKASYKQICGWCLGEVAQTEPITYTRESGWCHDSCTTRDAEAKGG